MNTSVYAAFSVYATITTVGYLHLRSVLGFHFLQVTDQLVDVMCARYSVACIFVRFIFIIVWHVVIVFINLFDVLFNSPVLFCFIANGIHQRAHIIRHVVLLVVAFFVFSYDKVDMVETPWVEHGAPAL
ncbi:MAG: hypothetical protein CMN60_20935 [Sphingobium sp.]|nr:hypothetical protein [Sphingobium sp.]MBS50103.1 hypothetical protein [Sphingobium sp.]